jgi:hypothetical protein
MYFIYKLLKFPLGFQFAWHAFFSLIALITFNFINYKFTDEEVSRVYYLYGIFIAANFVSHGIKEYFVFTDIRKNPSFFIKLCQPLALVFITSLVIILNENIYFIYQELHSNIFVILISALSLIYITIIGEIFGHVLISRGHQILPLLARALPPLLLLVYTTMSSRLYFIEFLLLNSIHYIFVIILFFYEPRSEKVIKNNPVDYKKAILFSAPFTISGGLTFLWVSFERTLWINLSAESFLSYQAYFMLQGVTYSIIIFPIINRAWSQYNISLNLKHAFQTLTIFYFLAIASAVCWIFVGVHVLKIMFPSYNLEQLNEVKILLQLFAFCIPIILNKLLLSRVYVTHESNRPVYYVDINASIATIFFCILCYFYNFWPGFIIFFYNIFIGIMMILYWIKDNGFNDAQDYWVKFSLINLFSTLGVLYTIFSF